MTAMTRMKIALVADDAMTLVDARDVVDARDSAEKKYTNIQCNVLRNHESNRVVAAI